LFHADLAGAVGLPRVDGDSLLAADSSSPDQPQAVELPVTVSGRLEAEDDSDAFAVMLKKDEKLLIEVESRSLGFPVDPQLVVLDDAGKAVAEQDDEGRSGRDPELAFTAPADGRFRIVVSDLHARGGLRCSYRVTLKRVAPDFRLGLAADSFVLAADKPLEIPVTVSASGGLREKIELQAVGLPAGVTCEAVTYEPPQQETRERSGRGRRRDSENAPSVKLVLKADAAVVQAGGAPFRVEGRTLSDPPLVRIATFDTKLPLAPPQSAAWLTVRK